jgi:hypothetical protein
MAKPRARLTPEIQSSICAYIRSGAFPHIAAEAAGVPQEVFDDWLRIGSAGKKSPRRYRRFASAVKQAMAHVRLRAEIRVLDADPKTWLTQGPGRHRARRPGWSGMVRPTEEADDQTPNLLADPALSRLMARLSEVLAPFPEARKAVADILQGAEEQEE